MSEVALREGERELARFVPSRAVYVKEHLMLAALGSVGAMGVLVAMGNPHAWTGAVGAIGAVAVRGGYLATDELKRVWRLTDQRLIGPEEQVISLSQVAKVRTILSAAQVITRSGDKYLIKYQPDPAAVGAAIEAAR